MGICEREMPRAPLISLVYPCREAAVRKRVFTEFAPHSRSWRREYSCLQFVALSPETARRGKRGRPALRGRNRTGDALGEAAEQEGGAFTSPPPSTNRFGIFSEPSFFNSQGREGFIFPPAFALLRRDKLSFELGATTTLTWLARAAMPRVFGAGRCDDDGCEWARTHR